MCPELWTIPILNFSIKGYGLMLMIAFFTGAFIAARRTERMRASSEVLLNCSIIALVGSMVGARLFYVIHYWEQQFANQPNVPWAVIDISRGGMEFYGGIIGAIAPILYYLWSRKESIRLYFDIMTPSLMWGLALTRLGCFLNGCCFGGVAHGVAEHWAIRFPYGSPVYLHQYKAHVLDVPDELESTYPSGRKGFRSREDLAGKSPELLALADRERSLPVHPAQIYASINAFCGSLFLSCLLRVRRRHGMVFAVWLLTYPLTRIIEEQIRVDNPLDTLGLTVSTAISIGMLALGAVLAVWFRLLPLRSPSARPWTPALSTPPKPKRAKASA